MIAPPLPLFEFMLSSPSVGLASEDDKGGGGSMTSSQKRVTCLASRLCHLLV